MKIILLSSMVLFLTSCKTNIIDHYDCAGKEELLTKTFTSCIESSNLKKCSEKETKTIEKNPIYACEDSSKELLCTPVYKEIKIY